MTASKSLRPPKEGTVRQESAGTQAPAVEPAALRGTGGPCQAGAPPWLWRGTVPSLNGLRAVSILVVIASHLSFREGPPGSWLPRAGEVGVDVFFVISGFLITLLLMREERRTETVSLRGFYLRRAFRILPAYACYLLALFLFQCLDLTHVSRHGWVSALTYTSSLSKSDDWDVGHTWSLSVEEHFYLVWPLLFLLTPPGRRFGVALGYVLLAPVLRVLTRAFLNVNVEFFTFTRMDSIAVGCCLAFLAASAGFRGRTGRLPPWKFYLLSCGGLLFIVLTKSWTNHAYYESRVARYYYLFLSHSLNSLVIAGLMWLLVTHPDTAPGRLLNSKIFDRLGVLSYSLYLWQQFFLNPRGGHGVHQWPLNISLVFVAALLSYHVVESPFLRLKAQLFQGRE